MSDVEFLRHLGQPPGTDVDEIVLERMRSAQAWFETYGKLTSARVEATVVSTDGSSVTLRSAGGHEVDVASELLARGFERRSVERVFVVAVSAGAEVDAEISRAWAERRPDDAMFLNAWGSVVVERRRREVFEELRRGSQENGRGLLASYSPGYEGWPLSGQHALGALLRSDEEAAERLRELEVLESGGLRPSKSTFVLFAEARESADDAETFWSSLASELSAAREIAYTFPEKALAKWSSQRLRIEETSGDRELRAHFRFAGTTCTNMGLEFALDFEIELERSSADAPFVVRAASCKPAKNDRGHLGMCAYRSAPDWFLAEVDASCPWIGHTLASAFEEGGSIFSGCLCTPGAREHKWRIVLQSLHFALESRAAQNSGKENVDG